MQPANLWLPVVSYGALMGFMASFTRLAVLQIAARQTAARLAATLAQERNDLRRLVEMTAALSSSVELAPVLEQVVAQGQALTHTQAVRLWLGTDDERRVAAEARCPGPPPTP